MLDKYFFLNLINRIFKWKLKILKILKKNLKKNKIEIVKNVNYKYIKSLFAKTDKRHFKKKKELIAMHYSSHIARSEPYTRFVASRVHVLLKRYSLRYFHVERHASWEEFRPSWLKLIDNA